MANSYKVPQDVEAEDKLIGPFSFRQFIYLGIVAMSIAAAWGLFLLFPLLAVIPIPVIIFFGALALPLRKDQPMETYLAAMWQFYIKPRNRMWMADGVVSRITIDIPLVVERQLTKSITGDQAISQFDYLSQIADTGGWSTRGVTQAPQAVTDTPVDDILDNTSAITQSFNSRLQHEDDARREELLSRVHSGSIVSEAPVQTPLPTLSIPVPPQYASTQVEDTLPVFDPAPKYMQQHVIQPFDASHKAHEQTPTPAHHQQHDHHAHHQAESQPQRPVETSAPVVTPAIMELAKDVSVETVARQLHHEEVERHGDEIVINLH